MENTSYQSTSFYQAANTSTRTLAEFEPSIEYPAHSLQWPNTKGNSFTSLIDNQQLEAENALDNSLLSFRTCKELVMVHFTGWGSGIMGKDPYELSQ